MRKSGILGAVLALSTMLAGPPMAAQQEPVPERGITPRSGSYLASDIDVVNLFNGNLTVTIPIGYSYPMREGWSYQLALVYNSHSWDFDWQEDPTPCIPPETCGAQAFPSKISNAGLGWMLTLGRLLPPQHDLNKSPNWAYLSPDGSTHTFYPTLHEDDPGDGNDFWYTRDNTYLRLKVSERRVEFPDGQSHFFRTNTELDRMEDRFGNWVQLNMPSPSLWRIVDSHGRQIDINRVAAPAASELDRQITSVEFDGPGGQRESWVLDWTTPSIYRDCQDTHSQTSDTVQVPLLRKVIGPEGAVYKIQRSNGQPAYNGYDNCSWSGTIESLELPTKGLIEYQYRLWIFPNAGLISPPRPYATETTGIKKRIVTDPTTGKSATWTYSNQIYGTPNPPNPYPPSTETKVDYPDGSDHYHYFMAEPEIEINGHLPWEYGLPFTVEDTLDDLYLSTRIVDNGGTQRTTWVKYTRDELPVIPTSYARSRNLDTNRRVVETRTKYLDDNGKTTGVVYDPSTFDGLGHFRVVTREGNFDGNETRTERTEYNVSPLHASGCYDIDIPSCTFSPVPTDRPWILNSFTFKQQEEVGKARQNYGFDPDTGFLDWVQYLKSGTSTSSDDVLVTYLDIVPSGGDGNTDEEKWKGGDTGNLSTTTYWLKHTYARGIRQTSRQYRPNGTAMPFYVLDNETIDIAGFVQRSRDPSGLPTDFDYDGLGRLTRIEPVGGTLAERMARTYVSYSWSNGSLGSKSKVETYTDCPAGAGGCTPPLAQGTTWFDGFGRVSAESRRRPGGAWSHKYTDRNGWGWITDVSEWAPNGSAATWTKYRDFDFSGRPTRIVLPDSGATVHQIDLDYDGVRRVYRTTRVGTGIGGSEETSTTTEYYDPFGRLVKVVEDGDVNGTTAEYSYDVGNRLTSVDQYKWGNHQFRTFDYDNRGFLTKEIHPEKGAQVNYGDYDAKGHPGYVRHGPQSGTRVSYKYDAAERVTEVRFGDYAGKLVKQFTYDNTGIGGTRAAGKMVRAQGFTDYADCIKGSGLTATVTQTYDYSGRGGKVSRKTTDVLLGGESISPILQEFTWTPLGDLQTQTYPSWPSQAYEPFRTVTYGYEQGFLTSVSDFAPQLTYHDNLTLASIQHANGVTTFIEKDPNQMQRPRRIYTTGIVGGSQFDTGNYVYDGVGNIKKIGSERYRYDLLSRLLEAEKSPTEKQVFQYNIFGNLIATTTTIGGQTTTINTPAELGTNRLSGASYDVHGNLTARNGALYTWDHLGRMMRMQNGGEDWIFLYTADDERIASIADAGIGVRRWTIRDLGNRVVRKYNQDDPPALGEGQSTPTNWTRDWIWRGGTLLAAVAGQTEHQHVDHLGSIRMVTRDDGTIVANHDYWPYGEEINPPTHAEPLRFTGHERDAYGTPGTEDDLDYMHARYAKPGMGRFLTTDSAPGNALRPQTWNRYTYVSSNPLRLYDPDGRLQRDSNGRLIFKPGEKGTIGHAGDPEAAISVRFGNLLADDGTPIHAFRNLSDDARFDCDCHGLTFADGEYWINNDQVEQLLAGDGYAETTSPEAGDIVVYRNSEGKVVHSATVTGQKENGTIQVSGLGGIEVSASTTRATPGPGGAWHDPNVSLTYYTDDDNGSRKHSKKEEDEDDE